MKKLEKLNNCKVNPAYLCSVLPSLCSLLLGFLHICRSIYLFFPVVLFFILGRGGTLYLYFFFSFHPFVSFHPLPSFYCFPIISSFILLAFSPSFFSYFCLFYFSTPPLFRARINRRIPLSAKVMPKLPAGA